MSESKEFTEEEIAKVSNQYNWSTCSSATFQLTTWFRMNDAWIVSFSFIFCSMTRSKIAIWSLETIAMVITSHSYLIFWLLLPITPFFVQQRDDFTSITTQHRQTYIYPTLFVYTHPRINLHWISRCSQMTDITKYLNPKLTSIPLSFYHRPRPNRFPSYYNLSGGAKVYDITKYLNDHPGGPEIMMEFAGKNAGE